MMRMMMKRLFLFTISLAGFVGLVGVFFYHLLLPHFIGKFIHQDLFIKQNIVIQYDKTSWSFKNGLKVENILAIKKINKDTLVLKISFIQAKIKVLSFIKNRELEISSLSAGVGEFFYQKKSKHFCWQFQGLHGFLKHSFQKSHSNRWLGRLCLEGLKNEAVQVKKINMRLGRRSIRYNTKDFSWNGKNIKCQGITQLFRKAQRSFALFKGDHLSLFLSYGEKVLSAQIFSDLDLKGVRRTRAVLRANFDHGFNQPLISINGLLRPQDFKFFDFDCWKDYLKDESLAIQFKGQWVGSNIASMKMGWGNLYLHLPVVDIKKFHLENLDLYLKFEQGHVFLKTLKARAYEGNIYGKGWYSSGPLYTGKIILSKINLNRLSPILFPKAGQTLDGDLKTVLNFTGFGFSLDQILAKGLVKVKEGNVWKINLMRKVLKVFNPIFSDLGQVKFTSCIAHFFIRQGILNLKQLKMLSTVLVMRLKGKMGLHEKDLDFELKLSLKPGGLKDKTFIAKMITSGLAVTGQQVWQMRIRGNLQNPKVTPLFLSVFDPIKDLIKTPFQIFKGSKKMQNKA